MNDQTYISSYVCKDQRKSNHVKKICYVNVTLHGNSVAIELSVHGKSVLTANMASMEKLYKLHYANHKIRTNKLEKRNMCVILFQLLLL